jgi:hypothetical protein
MQPNLREWLRPYSELTGSVVPVNPRKKLDLVRKAAGACALATERAST